MTSWK